ncbi:MAG: bifunctional nuclease domain-containing protein [Thermomicrobiales bacterium]
MKPEVIDNQLVEAARRGDKDAFATLVVRHRPLLVRLCQRALGDTTLAEDAAQEAALQAFLSLDRLHNPVRFGSWLAGIGLNVCRRWQSDRLRSSWSWEALIGGQLVREPLDDKPSPEAATEAADLRAQVQRAVAGLPSGQRGAVLLFYLEGFTHAETATLLGIEVGAVKTRLHKARTTLRRRLLAEWKAEETMDEKLNRRTLAKGTGALAGMAAVGKIAPDAAAAEQPVTMRIRDVRRYRVDEVPHPQRHVVLLEDEHKERTLPIWIGQFEGVALALQLEKVQSPRPMAYQLTAGIIEAAGGTLREVRISRLADEVFYAEVVVDGPAGVRAVDARPSDALNLALLTGAPISVDPLVLRTADQCPEARWQAEGVEDAKAIVAGMLTEWSQTTSSLPQMDEAD